MVGVWLRADIMRAEIPERNGNPTHVLQGNLEQTRRTLGMNVGATLQPDPHLWCATRLPGRLRGAEAGHLATPMICHGGVSAKHVELQRPAVKVSTHNSHNSLHEMES